MPECYIALIGKTNVGKSTLFQRLTKHPTLIHADQHTTRDRLYARAVWNPHIVVCDTAGYDTDSSHHHVQKAAFAQTMQAFHQAHIALFMLDGRHNIEPDEWELAKRLRKSGKTIFTIVNKCEGQHGHSTIEQAWRLGWGEPIAISAQHGDGIAMLTETLEQTCNLPQPAKPENQDDTKTIIALIGRPNVGKSTFINALLQENRMVTSPHPATTRQAIALDVVRNNTYYQIIDTAGVRRRQQKNQSIETQSIDKTYAAIEKAHVVLLMTDISCEPSHQDIALAADVQKKGRPLILLYNKCDLVHFDKKAFAAWQNQLHRKIEPLHAIQTIAISAQYRRAINDVFPAIERAVTNWRKQIMTAKLNQWLQQAQRDHPIPSRSIGGRTKIRYATQIATCPPRFLLFTSKPQAISQSYRRYLSKNLKKYFQIDGTPIRIHFRKE